MNFTINDHTASDNFTLENTVHRVQSYIEFQRAPLLISVTRLTFE